MGSVEEDLHSRRLLDLATEVSVLIHSKEAAEIATLATAEDTRADSQIPEDVIMMTLRSTMPENGTIDAVLVAVALLPEGAAVAQAAVLLLPPVDQRQSLRPHPLKLNHPSRKSICSTLMRMSSSRLRHQSSLPRCRTQLMMVRNPRDKQRPELVDDSP